MTDRRYFVAVLIPEPAASRIRALQELAARNYDCKAALRSPPHITLVPPFKVSPEKIDQLNNTLHDHTSIYHEPIDLRLHGFDSFGNRVIFVKVEKNNGLTLLATSLSSSLREAGFGILEESREYHPHVTVAFKDLAPSMFISFREVLREKSIDHAFAIQTFALLRHEDARWKVDTEFGFSS